jgi:beta-mannosidase
MPRTIKDLSGSSWRFGAVDRQPFAPSPRRPCLRVCLAACTVPGDTRSDLIAWSAPGFYSPAALRESEWVDDRDWWYTLPLKQVEPGLTAVLEAEGIDYLSSIWLDERCLRVHEGMFSRQTVILSPLLDQPGAHELGIRIWGSGALRKSADGPVRRTVRGLLKRAGVGAEYFPDRMNVTKAQFAFGWDFAPRVLTCGIWDDIRLVLARGAYIEDVDAVAEPLDETADPVPVRWRTALIAPL